MNETLVKMFASQIGIPGAVIDELMSARPKLIGAVFLQDGVENDLATLTVEVSGPTTNFPVVVTLPLKQLRRFPAIYERAVTLANL